MPEIVSLHLYSERRLNRCVSGPQLERLVVECSQYIWVFLLLSDIKILASQKSIILSRVMVQYLYADDWSTRWLWVPIVVNLYKETPSFTSGKSSRIYANALALFFFIISFSKGEHLFNGNQEVLHVPNHEF